MKHIGIISITIVGAAACAKAIVSSYAKQFNSDDHPEFTLHALSFGEYKKYMLANEYDKVIALIVKSIKTLEKAGVDFVIMPSNTPHIVYEQVIKQIDMPFLNLIELTAAECAKYSYQKVAILGTTMTAQSGLYADALQAQGLEFVLPSQLLQNEMHDIIQNILIPQKEDSQRIANLINQLKNLSCDAYILGCTELPEILNQNNLGKPVVDTVSLLAQKAVDLSKAVTTS